MNTFIFIFSTTSIFGQVENWNKLVPLESNRTEVEKILGKPEVYFATSGVYITEIGKFYVNYSKGGCHKDFVGWQWNVPAGKLTLLTFFPNKSEPLKSYIADLKGVEKKPSPVRDNRFLYFSPDESLFYETIELKAGKEFVNTIGLGPGKNKQNLLCKIGSK